MPVSLPRIRQYLKQFEFRNLFIEEFGWDRSSGSLEILIDGQIFNLTAIAQKRSMVLWLCNPDNEGNIPTQTILVKLERQITKSSFEHLVVYYNHTKTRQLWQFAKRESGRPTYRTHRFDINQSGESLAQKLLQLAFSLDEEEQITLIDVTRRVNSAFYVEKVTKHFYEDFQEHHKQFLKFIKGIPDEQLQRWYASVMLNRLMFIYFIQKKGFLNSDVNYLKTKLRESKAKGKDQFYSTFLVKLFFEGFAKKLSDRPTTMNKLLGNIPYLNGGLFLPHQIEEKYGKKIEITDKVFDILFNYFDRYQWHLDERPLKDDLEINPDVLGYIFEKYINQKEMGAYYTKEDITGYNSQNTIIPRIFDIAKEKCAIAFEGEHSIWNLLKADPNRYIYEAVKRGIEKPLPPSIAAGISDVNKRTEWNKPADSEYALPTEIWREVVSRRQRYEELNQKLTNGEIQEINDFITYNLDIRQFAQDVIENCEGSDLLTAFWYAVVKLTVLDPTCGSGAFLFAALNILELLYEACLDRMQDFVDSDNRLSSNVSSGNPSLGQIKYAEFRSVLERITKHPNSRYFIYKSIIVNNLFGVDIMEEAVEICKLRLFLKLVAQVESVTQIEPLPDIDFNIRAGNTLVGFARMEDYNHLFGNPLGLKTDADIAAEILARKLSEFHSQQLEKGSADDQLKKDIIDQLEALSIRFNNELRQAYGFKKDEVKEFVISHRPFHWCVEFFDIMSRGGFDVIIGNPPFVEYSKIRNKYKVRGYETEECGNLYAFIAERSLSLLSRNGSFGFILPISFVCTQRMQKVQDLLIAKSGNVYLSNYAERPSKLFSGAEVLITICLARLNPNPNTLIFSTGFIKWSSEERPVLFEKITYNVIQGRQRKYILPKISGSIENSILSKLEKQDKTLIDFLLDHSKHPIYYRIGGGRYWKIFTNFQPKFILNGKQSVSSRENYLYLSSKVEREVVIATLSSSLFYWYFILTTNCRDLNPSDLKSFSLNMNLLKANLRNDIIRQNVKLMKDYKKNSELKDKTSKLTGKIQYQEYYPRLSKSIIDEIDRVLAKHYNFTDEELDFIINYDIKYRMGKNNEEEE